MTAEKAGWVEASRKLEAARHGGARPGAGRKPGSKNRPRDQVIDLGESVPEVSDQPEAKLKAAADKKFPPMPRIVSNFISEIPYKAAKAASEEFILNRGLPEDKKSKLNDLEPESLQAIHESFDAWIRSLEMSMSPLAQVILVQIAACGAVALGAGIKRGVINGQMRLDKKKIEDAKREPKPEPVKEP